MCLDILKKNNEVLVAETDIVVYKYLKITAEGWLKTPFQCSYVEIGNKYESKLKFTRHSDHNFDDSFPDDLLVGFVSDGLHSYASFKDAYRSYCCDKSSRIVVKCIIPKGSKYYIGEFDSRVSYASENLIYIKKFNWFSILFNRLKNK